MRIPRTVALAATAATLALAAPPSASARDLVIGIWPGGPDPYQYRSVPVGYYPYYDSGYWRTRAEMRYRYRKPLLVGPYWSAWGYPTTCDDANERCRARAAQRRPSK